MTDMNHYDYIHTTHTEQFEESTSEVSHGADINTGGSGRRHGVRGFRLCVPLYVQLSALYFRHVKYQGPNQVGGARHPESHP
jgi:hypothetical protein